MNEMLSTERQGKQETSHLTKLKYFHNTKLWLGPSSLKIHFLQPSEFADLIRQTNFTKQWNKREDTWNNLSPYRNLTSHNPFGVHCAHLLSGTPNPLSSQMALLWQHLCSASAGLWSHWCHYSPQPCPCMPGTKASSAQRGQEGSTSKKSSQNWEVTSPVCSYQVWNTADWLIL